MALTETKWNAFQAEVLVCLLMAFWCLHTATGMTFTHHHVDVECDRIPWVLTALHGFALAQGCQGGAGAWMVRTCSE